MFAVIANLNFDGTTDLSFIENLKLNSKELVLLFSDGINGLGQESNPNIFKPNVFSIVTSISSDFNALQNFSNNNLLNLNRIKVETAIQKIQNPPLTLLAVEVINGNIVDLFPKMESAVYSNMELCGKLIGNEATINLAFGYAGTKLFTKTILVKYDKNRDLALKNDQINTLISRYWAQNEINQLMLNLSKNKNKIKYIAKKYSIVTNYTSLIVLETMSDYMRYNVTPPAELKEEFDNYMEKFGKLNIVEKKVETVDEIVEKDMKSYYKPLLDWWKNPVKIVNPVKKKTTRGEGSIKGKVTGSEKDIVQYVQIRLERDDQLINRTMSDANGEYAFYGIPRGTYTIIVGGAGLCMNTTRYTNLIVDGVSVIFKNLNYECRDDISEVEIVSETRLFDSNETTQTIVDGVRVRGNRSDVILTYDEENNEQSRSVRQKTIDIKPYIPNEAYMEVYNGSVSNKDLYQVYLTSRVNYLNSPSYFVDVADEFCKRGMKDTAKMILSNMLEISNENFQIVQIYGKKLTEYGFYKEAVPVFRYITDLREEFPQSFRDYALSCQYAGLYQEAYDVFVFILTTRWNRFDLLKPIVFTDFNGLLNLYGKQINQKNLNPSLRAVFPVGMRVVISWDTDNCDIDLHVKEPDGTTCFYNHNLTKNGGKLSSDFINGFGPEQYMMKSNIDGIYEILANYYGSNSQSELMPVTVYADLFINYGTPKQEHKRISLRLIDKKDIYSMGEIEVTKD